MGGGILGAQSSVLPRQDKAVPSAFVMAGRFFVMFD
jgi:hypothetical protein